MKAKIWNFTNADELEVSAGVHADCGPLVTLVQRRGSLGFQFDMEPGQARELAAALIAGAEELESLKLPEVSA